MSMSSWRATIWPPFVEDGTMIGVLTPAAYQASMPSRTSAALLYSVTCEGIGNWGQVLQSYISRQTMARRRITCRR
jgi:hypothetical protein